MQRAGISLFSGLLSIVLLSMAGSASSAVGWRTNYGLTTQAIATDNLNLAPGDPISDVGIRIQPSIGIRRDVRRNKLYFQYALSYLNHFNSTTRNNIRHFLTANWNSELYSDKLFLDVKANADQTLIFPFGPSGGDDFNNTRNTTQTFTYSVSPYTLLHFKGYADLQLRYTHDQVIYSENIARDSYSDGVSFNLDSGRRFTQVPWNVTGEYRRVRYDEQGGPLDFGRDNQFRTTLATVGYQLSRKWRPNLYVGYDNNDFATLQNEPKGAIYGAGVTWTPNPRTELDLAYGHRFFGNNWYMTFNHKQRRSVFRANLTHDIQTSRDETLNRRTFQPDDPFGNPVIDPITGQPIELIDDTPTLSTQAYVLSRFDLGYNLLLNRRDTVGLSAYYTIRDYQVTLREELRRGINASWSHGLSANTNANLRLWWEKFRLASDVSDDTTWRISLGVTHRLTKRTSLSLDLRHLERDSATPLLDYTENRVTLTLGTSWK